MAAGLYSSPTRRKRQIGIFAFCGPARGGGYGPGTPREGWDHATPYLRRIFEDVFRVELTIVECELTLADVTPAMAELRETAATLRVRANEHAVETGRAMARRLAAA